MEKMNLGHLVVPENKKELTINNNGNVRNTGVNLKECCMPKAADLSQTIRYIGLQLRMKYISMSPCYFKTLGERSTFPHTRIPMNK